MSMLRWFRPNTPSRIVVPMRAVASGEPRHLLSAVQRFVTVMRETGFWLDHELPRAAILACRAATYHCQVTNGGHAQFAFTSRMDPGVIAGTLEALLAAGFADFHRCLAEWRDLHARSGSAGPPAGAARDLDTVFFASLDGRAFHQRLASWLLDQGVVEVVRDRSFDGRIARLVRLNPDRDRRRDDLAVETLQARLVSPVKAGLGAAGLLSPGGICLVRKLGAASFLRIAGREARLWKVETSDASLVYGLEAEASFALLPEPPPRLTSDPEAAAFLAALRPRATVRQVIPAIRHAEDWRPALALALLLRGHHDLSEVTAMVCLNAGSGIGYLVEVAGRRLLLCYTGLVCGLSDLSDGERILGSLPLAELQARIEAFDARAEARRMPPV